MQQIIKERINNYFVKKDTNFSFWVLGRASIKFMNFNLKPKGCFFWVFFAFYNKMFVNRRPSSSCRPTQTSLPVAYLAYLVRGGKQRHRSIFRMGGGGWGVKIRKMPNFSARFARKVAISNLFALSARQKWKFCMFSGIFMLNLMVL